jgi:hypothetical protein
MLAAISAVLSRRSDLVASMGAFCKADRRCGVATRQMTGNHLGI